MIDRIFCLLPEALPSELRSDWAGPTEKPQRISDLATKYAGVGYLSIEGSMMHGRSRYWWSLSVSYQDITSALQSMQHDPEISRVIVSLDSPGGTVAGVDRATQAMADLAKVKPVVVHSPAIIASGAMHLAAPATKIVVSQNTVVGSIGVFAVLSDYSKMFAEAGIEMHLISSGGIKGQGQMGTPVTAGQKDQTQRLVNYFNNQFLLALAQGRKLTQDRLSNVSGGYVWVGQQAIDVGLVDAVGTFEDALSMLLGMKAPKTPSQTYAERDNYIFSMVNPDYAEQLFREETKLLTDAEISTRFPKSLERFKVKETPKPHMRKFHFP